MVLSNKLYFFCYFKIIENKLLVIKWLWLFCKYGFIFCFMLILELMFLEISVLIGENVEEVFV